jgi:hypothetical protein
MGASKQAGEEMRHGKERERIEEFALIRLIWGQPGENWM